MIIVDNPTQLYKDQSLKRKQQESHKEDQGVI